MILTDQDVWCKNVHTPDCTSLAVRAHPTLFFDIVLRLAERFEKSVTEELLEKEEGAEANIRPQPSIKE